MNSCRKEEINTSPPESGWNQDKFATMYCLFYFTSSPPPLCSIKETSVQTQARWVFGTPVHHLLGLLAFLIKSLLLAPQVISWFIGLWCRGQYELELSNNVKILRKSILFIYLFIFWSCCAACGGLSSATRNRTPVPCSGSTGPPGKSRKIILEILCCTVWFLASVDIHNYGDFWNFIAQTTIHILLCCNFDATSCCT